ncbi:outer membrane protein [Rhodopila sp.]|uniref:outer membrane protein n=1 Tax=Rhodopila sp. TaxID=2480087 RepID=UPI003D0CBA5D
MIARMALLACALFLPVVAQAQPLNGFYVGGETGVNFAGSLSSSDQTTKVYTDPGPLGLVDLGWGYGNGLRTEVEGSYRSNHVAGISTRRGDGSLEPLGGVSASAMTYAVMANILYDIPLRFPVQPYIGAGLGYGWLDFGNGGGAGFGRLGLAQGNTYTGPTTVSFGSAGAFAYQAIVGLSTPLRLLSGLQMTLEYRFFGMSRADILVNRTATNTTNLINGATPSLQTRNGFSVEDNAILIGLRYTFGGL